MDKFGIFDILTKLSTNKTATDGLSEAVKKISNSLLSSQNSALNETREKVIVKNERSKKPKFSQSAILQVLKKHDELSRQIDLNNKKP